MSRSPKRARWRRRLLVVLVGYALLELLSLLGLLVLREVRGVRYLPLETDRLTEGTAAELERVLVGRLDYLRPDPVLGWSIQASGSGGLYRANAQGLRAEVEYAAAAAPGRVRIAAFGDSFTHGDDVAANDTWQVQLEASAPDAEVLNFGVPAYGPGQAYLRYRERGREFSPQVVLIGLMAENVFRAVNVFRPFYSPGYVFPLTKPRFAMRDGRLVLLDNPLRDLADYRRLRDEPARVLPVLGADDVFYHERYRTGPFDLSPVVRLVKLLGYAYRRATASVIKGGVYNVEHEAFSVVTGVLRRFHDAVLNDGGRPLIVVFPSPVLARGSGRQRVYQPLLEWLRRDGLAYADLQTGFDELADQNALDELYVGRYGHYSPVANGIVARYLHRLLVERGWLAVDRKPR